MGIIQHVLYEAEGGDVYVLYSIVNVDINNNQYREFWLTDGVAPPVLLVTIAVFHRISIGVSGGIFLSDTQDAGVSGSFSGTYTLSVNEFPGYTSPVLAAYQSNHEYTLSGSEASISFAASGSIYRNNDLSYTVGGDVDVAEGSWFGGGSVTLLTNAITVTQSASVTANATNLNGASGDGDTGAFADSGNANVRLNVDELGAGASDSASDSWSHTQGLGSKAMATEGFLSEKNGQLTVLIKAQADTGQDFMSVYYGTPDNLSNYTKYINEIDLPALGAGDVREPIIDHRLSTTGADESPDKCIQTYVDNPFVLLRNGTDLRQVTGTQSALQASLRGVGVDGFYTGSLRVATVSAGMSSCEFNSQQNEPISIPGIPANAELLSIARLP